MINKTNITLPETVVKAEVVGGWYSIAYIAHKYSIHLTFLAWRLYTTLIDLSHRRPDPTVPIKPTYAYLKKCSGITRDADIAKALDELELFGWIERTRRFNKSSIYQLFIPNHLSPTKDQSAAWKELYKRNGAIVKSDTSDQQDDNPEIPY